MAGRSASNWRWANVNVDPDMGAADMGGLRVDGDRPPTGRSGYGPSPWGPMKRTSRAAHEGAARVGRRPMRGDRAGSASTRADGAGTRAGLRRRGPPPSAHDASA